VASPDPAFRFERTTIPFTDGMTLAAALVAAGELGLRESRDGGRRGVFCGMGVCHECLVTVDGRPGQRACMTPAAPGLEVTRQPARADLSAPGPQDCRGTAAGSIDDPDLDSIPDDPDLLVVGGGPGGLTAAAAAAEAGLRVVVLDERSKLGGQYFKPRVSSGRHGGPPPDAQFAAGEALRARVARAGVIVAPGTEVWGAFGPGDIATIGPHGRRRLRPHALVLAPGAYERALPIPGWTLPGVMTTGAAQTLWRSYGTPPGRRVLIAGNGPLNMQVAAELCRAGATVAALAELGTPTSPRRARALARMALADPGLVVQGARYGAILARGRVPVFNGATVVAIEGEDRVRAAVLARIDRAGNPVPGSERRFEVDAVCLGFGFHPSTEIARALGAVHVPGPDGLQTVVDARGRTSLPGVWVVGDGARIGGARLAQAVGELAGADVARALAATAPGPPGTPGTPGTPGAPGAPGAPAARNAEREAVRQRHFQAGLAAAFAAPQPGERLAAPETLICRCEDVSRAAIERALGDGPRHIGALKRAIRVGMGPCQGRYCGPLVAAMTARRLGEDLTEMSGFAPNPPVKPVAIGDLLGPAGAQSTHGPDVAAAIRDAGARLAAGAGEPVGEIERDTLDRSGH
jgi:NADPH-dependent 2,4-dienoyl-CoA reductase/sulfur reductase-like enzyme